MLDQVTDNLYIGNARLIQYIPSLQGEGISSILKLHETPPERPSNTFRLFDCPIPDGEPILANTFDSWLDFLGSEISQGHKVLVICGAGISRSSTAVLAYLTSTGQTLPDAYRLLCARHPSTSPHPLLWESLIHYFDLPYTRLDIFQWHMDVQG